MFFVFFCVNGEYFYKFHEKSVKKCEKSVKKVWKSGEKVWNFGEILVKFGEILGKFLYVLGGGEFPDIFFCIWHPQTAQNSALS